MQTVTLRKESLQKYRPHSQKSFDARIVSIGAKENCAKSRITTSLMRIFTAVVQKGEPMTVGEVIALLTTYASDNYEILMSVSIYDIEVHDDYITVFPTNGSSSAIDICAERRTDERKKISCC